MPLTRPWPPRAAYAPLRKLLLAFGLDVEYVGRAREPALPDGAAYRPRFRPWLVDSWQQCFTLTRGKTLVSDDRLYVLASLMRQALATVAGDVAECGVYQGGTAALLAETMRERGDARRLFLCDTFAGMPDTDPAVDIHRKGDFSDTSLAAVRSYLAAYANIEYLPGVIPASLAPLAGKRFCFVHIDLDIHAAVLDASSFFYERVASGGFLVYDDYGFASTPGARLAVDEFYADKLETPLVLAGGQCVVFKAGAR
ncbi:MAG TPA: TylF/MycF/NovP-related O-methyltransferase [Candidatus Eremiobacteraceae bacterium]|nr:TylF/MycF/NovP-related O-methyltransferase [Candidatus Eremiobacteraceae bacterium]